MNRWMRNIPAVLSFLSLKDLFMSFIPKLGLFIFRFALNKGGNRLIFVRVNICASHGPPALTC